MLQAYLFLSLHILCKHNCCTLQWKDNKWKRLHSIGKLKLEFSLIPWKKIAKSLTNRLNEVDNVLSAFWATAKWILQILTNGSKCRFKMVEKHTAWKALESKRCIIPAGNKLTVLQDEKQINLGRLNREYVIVWLLK